MARPTGAKSLRIWGRRSVLAALDARARTFDEVWIAEGAAGRAVREVESAAASRGVRVQRVAPERIEREARGAAHQGVLLLAGPLPGRTLSELLAAAGPNGFLLALDHPQDPHHLGAAIRSAEALGAAGVVTTREKSAPLSGAAAKAAAGAIDRIPIAAVGDLVEAIRTARAAGWRAFAAAASPAATPIADVDLAGRVLLVVGSEGHGLAPRVAGACDASVRVPLAGRTESLSLSAAAAILLYEVARRRENPSR